MIGAETARLGLRRLNPLRHIESRLKPRPRTSFGKVAVLESSLYMRNQLLRDTDWASMAHSLEVRVPLVDVELLRHLAAVTATHRSLSKRMLANSPRRPASVQSDRTFEDRVHNSDPWRGCSAISASSSGDRFPRLRPGNAPGRGAGPFRWRRPSGNVMVESSLRVLALVTDAFGGHGGIAQYNRDFLSSLAACDRIGDVIVLPRARGGRDRGLLERLIACAEMKPPSASWLGPRQKERYELMRRLREW